MPRSPCRAPRAGSSHGAALGFPVVLFQAIEIGDRFLEQRRCNLIKHYCLCWVGGLRRRQEKPRLRVSARVAVNNAEDMLATVLQVDRRS